MASENWKDYEDWVYPYKNIRDPKYIKDRDKTFAKHGNGWGWGKGWWSGHHDTVAERQRRARKKRRAKYVNENTI